MTRKQLTSFSVFTPTNAAGLRCPSSFTSVMHSTFILMALFSEWDDVTHVSIHESGSAFSKPMQFYKNHHTIIKNGCTLSAHATEYTFIHDRTVLLETGYMWRERYKKFPKFILLKYSLTYFFRNIWSLPYFQWFTNLCSSILHSHRKRHDHILACSYPCIYLWIKYVASIFKKIMLTEIRMITHWYEHEPRCVSVPE